MKSRVYKSEKGRLVIEAFYRKILNEFSNVGFEEIFIPTTIARTHVLKCGDTTKPPLILLHGSASNSAVWLSILSEFSEHFCTYCVDIPGEPGLSDPVRCSLRSDDPYKWLSSLLDNLSIEKASFLSISLGSWYALNFAVRSPEKVRSLSMLTTSGIVPAKRSFIFKALLFMMIGDLGQKMLSRTIYYKTNVPQEVLVFQSIISKHFIPLMEIIPIFSDDLLRKIKSPLQFFGGDHDALINSVKTAERIKKVLPNSDINILKDTGHAIVNQFTNIKKFLM